jgi:hypothetical protein
MTVVSAAEISDFFRSVNERILELSSSLISTAEFVCECPDEHCTTAMQMTPAEYGAMALHPGLHAVVPGHERFGSLEIVARADRYVVVRSRLAPRRGPLWSEARKGVDVVRDA